MDVITINQIKLWIKKKLGDLEAGSTGIGIYQQTVNASDWQYDATSGMYCHTVTHNLNTTVLLTTGTNSDGEVIIDSKDCTNTTVKLSVIEPEDIAITVIGFAGSGTVYNPSSSGTSINLADITQQEADDIINSVISGGTINSSVLEDLTQEEANEAIDSIISTET